MILCLGAQATAAQSSGLVCASRSTIGWCDTPGRGLGLAVRGSEAFVADGSEGLSVVDLSDPANPTLIGSVDTPDEARRVALLDDLALVADSRGGLQIIDISDPTQPLVAGALTQIDRVYDVDTADGLAYVADGREGLLVVDVSDPANPTVIGSLATPEAARDLQVVGELVYLIEWGEGLRVIDVSDPASPLLIGAADTENALGVSIAGTHAYVVGAEGLTVFDVSEPTSPQLVTHVASALTRFDIVTERDLAIVDGGGQVFDISDPAQPELLGSFPHGGADAVLRGSLVIAAGQDGLVISDLGLLPRSGLLGSVSVPNGYETVEVIDGYALMATPFTGLSVVDVADPTSPSLVTTLPLGAYTHDVGVQGGYAFVCDGVDDLRVVDISDPEQPVVALTVPDSSASRLDLQDGTLCLLGSHRLCIFDVSDPLAPVRLGNHPVPSEGRRHGGVMIDDGFAYVVRRSELLIFDLSQPSLPAVSQTTLSVSGTGVHVRDGVVYLTHSRGLSVWDVSDPSAPEHLSETLLPIGNGPEAVDLFGRFALIAVVSHGVWAVDVSDPRSPRVAGSDQGWWPRQSTYDIDIRDGVAYVVDPSDRGLYILDLSDCPPCPADFNADGTVNTQDFIAFLAAWASQRNADCSSGDCSADLNADGTVNTQDFVEFLNLWAAGC